MPFVDRAVVFTRPLRMSSDEIPPYLSRFMIALSRASAILDLSLRSCQGGEDMGGVKGKRRFVRSRSGFCVCVAARGATTKRRAARTKRFVRVKRRMLSPRQDSTTSAGR